MFEQLVVAGYKAFAWVISHLPPAIPKVVLARGAQLSYLLWPTKRRWSNANFGHVLGLAPNNPRVWRTALHAYAAYGRYVVELARLPRLAREHADELVAGADLDRVHEIWQASKGGLIFSLGHVGNAEAVAAGVASRGWPINVVADDSSFPGLFEEFSRTREQWGVHIIPWRNLREIYAVLRRREMLALLIDWGYREDGIPVKLFGMKDKVQKFIFLHTAGILPVNKGPVKDIFDEEFQDLLCSCFFYVLKISGGKVIFIA